MYFQIIDQNSTELDVSQLGGSVDATESEFQNQEVVALEAGFASAL